MSITASELRANVYRLLDEVLETGQPLEIDRGGRTLRIIAVEPSSRVAALPKRPEFLVGDPEDLVSMDWTGEWAP